MTLVCCSASDNWGTQVALVDVYEEEDYQSTLYGFSLCSQFDAEQATGTSQRRRGDRGTEGGVAKRE